MKPDYESPGVQLYRGDCLDVMPTLVEDNISTFVTSPPYNQHIDKFKPSGMQKKWNWTKKISSGYFDSMPEDEYQEWQIKFLNESFRIVPVGGSLFYNHKIRWRKGVLIHPLDFIRKSDWDLRQEIVWRRDGSPTMNARMFAPNDERIYWLRKGRHRWNQDCVGYLSVWSLNSVKRTKHACVFPIEIPDRCIRATTDPDDTVLDPFMGSGTTGVACINTGRKFIGIEIEQEYFDIAVQRIEETQQQLSLL